MSYSIGDYLVASPFSDSTDFDGELTEDIFYEEYFMYLDEYSFFSNELDRLINHTAKSRLLTIFLYGYSGVGKTTFIRWLCKKEINNYETVFFDFADVVGSQHYGDTVFYSHTGLKIFDYKMRDLLCGLYPNNGKELRKLLCNIERISDYIQTTFSATFFDELYSLKELNISTSNDFRNEFFKFVRKIGYLDLLLIIFLFYYHNPEVFLTEFTDKNEVDTNLPLIIVFDNIDHVEIEHENSKFPRQIEKVYHNYHRILREYKKINKEFKIDSKRKVIKFIFCMRDANVSLLNRQVAEDKATEELYFSPSDLDKDVLMKRIKIAEEKGISIEPSRKKLLKYILDDPYTKKVFKPLFNLNNRKLAHLISNTIVPHNGTYLRLLKELTINKNANGARGIEFYLIIKQLQKSDFLKETIFVDDGKRLGDGGSVNPARIILTNLLNLSKFSLNSKLEISNYTPVGLFDLYVKFREIFKNRYQEFFYVLSKLFLTHKSNWCHLISFNNKRVFNVEDFNSEVKKIETWEKLNKENNNNKYNIENDLNKITLSLNPSGYIYIKDIIKHYENFSLKANNTKPLFASLNYEKKGADIFNFEFIQNIINTKNVTKKCVESLKRFLNSNIVEDFEYSSHVFRTYKIEEGDNEDFYENKIGRLLIVRIIHTHIRYIDDFRISILNNENYWKGMSNNKNVLYKIRFDVNKLILNQLQEYIDMLKGTKGSVKNLIDTLEINIDNLKKTSSMNQSLLKCD